MYRYEVIFLNYFFCPIYLWGDIVKLLFCSDYVQSCTHPSQLTCFLCQNTKLFNLETHPR